jgi:DNA-binding transcriptional MerR regulator
VPERSEVGYRLYAADNLLRLQRVRWLQSLGLSPDRIKGVLGEPGADAGLREVLEALLVEVQGQLAAFEERQDRIRETLDWEDLELPEGEPRAMKLAEGVPGRIPPGSEPLARRAGAKDIGDARGLRLARGVRERARVPGRLLRTKPRRIPGCARAG